MPAVLSAIKHLPAVRDKLYELGYRSVDSIIIGEGQGRSSGALGAGSSSLICCYNIGDFPSWMGHNVSFWCRDAGREITQAQRDVSERMSRAYHAREGSRSDSSSDENDGAMVATPRMRIGSPVFEGQYREDERNTREGAFARDVDWGKDVTVNGTRGGKQIFEEDIFLDNLKEDPSGTPSAQSGASSPCQLGPSSPSVASGAPLEGGAHSSKSSKEGPTPPNAALEGRASSSKSSFFAPMSAARGCEGLPEEALAKRTRAEGEVMDQDTEAAA